MLEGSRFVRAPQSKVLTPRGHGVFLTVSALCILALCAVMVVSRDVQVYLPYASAVVLYAGGVSAVRRLAGVPARRAQEARYAAAGQSPMPSSSSLGHAGR
ncbi:MAG: hypothetical protein NVSMB65_09880 [Chloroflexota bacterium]